MPDSVPLDSSVPRPDRRTLSATALRSTKAGLVALALVSFALATFGPWFNLILAYSLMVASMLFAIVALWWADRAGHDLRRIPATTNGIYAKAGAALSILALLLAAYYTGLLVVLLFLWPFALVAFLLAWAFHRAFVSTNDVWEVGA